MQPIIKDIRDVSDSKEMYETKPNPFIGFFIYIILTLIILGGIWLYFGEIDIVSKGKGIVRPNQNMSAIRNQVQGIVTVSYLEEGHQVTKGDILFEINHEDLDINRVQIIENLDEVQESLARITKLKDSIEQGKNLFSKETEKEYYDRYVKYEQDYLELQNNMKISLKTEEISQGEMTVNRDSYNYKIKKYEDQIANLVLFKQSVEEEKNYFTDQSNSYAIKLETYLMSLAEMDKGIADKEAEYHLSAALEAENFFAAQDLEAIEVALERAKNERKVLKMNTIKEITDHIEDITTTKQLAEQEMKKLIIDDELKSTKENQLALSIEQYKTDNLVTLYNQIEELNVQYKSQSRDLEEIELSISNCTVVAPIDGTLNITNKINEGDLLTMGLGVQDKKNNRLNFCISNIR